MGALYLACVGDKGLERTCVIKTVLPHLADPEYIARFRDEAKVVVRLSHGNLVPVFDAGLVGNELYLAMDYVEGKDLRAVWNRCAKKGIAFPVDVAVYIVKELARGLHYAHNFGGIKLVHRDVSPPNVLVAFSGETKLTDFGLASSTLKIEKTAAGIIYGKVSYMSPEQARGDAIDGRTDIYAAGIILWELLTGRQLFPQNQGEGGSDLIERVRNPVIDPPSVRAPRVPAMLDQIVLRALAKNPDERYSSGEQFRADLTAFLASNRDYLATDAARVGAFMTDLFDEDIARERDQRRELIDNFHERLEENERQELAEREAAEQKAQRKADILAAIDRQNGGDAGGDAGRLREEPLDGRIADQLTAYDTGKVLGTVIDRWRILRKIGEGGMGRVFEAEHQEIGRKVAIKILRPVYSHTPEVVARFRMEARAASKIGHPNIIEITDSNTTVDGSFYFVMELLEGKDLADRLQNEGKLPVDESLIVAQQVAQALAAAHGHNIIHRDLKPENIYLINRDGNPNFVKVLDFGIAKSLEEEKYRLTQPGLAMGTPEYMAPEQAAGKGSDARSDIYSLGAILYEMLAGHAPVDGENLMEILMRKATEDPVDLASVRPDVPPSVARLVMKALSRLPESRPQTMADFAAELGQCLQRIRDGVIEPPSPPSKPVMGPRSQPDLLKTLDRDEERRGNRRLIGWAVLSGGVLGLLGAAYFALTPPPVRPVTGGPGPVVTPPTGPATGPATGPGVGTRPNPNTNPNPNPNPGTNPAGTNPAGTNPGGTNPAGTNPGGTNPPQPGTRPGTDTPSTSPGKPKLGPNLPMPAFVDRAVAVGRIEDGHLAINSGRSEVAFNLCYAAAGNPQVRGSALTCMGEAEFGRGRYGEAIKWGKKALKEKAAPSKDINLLLGMSYYKLGNCRESRSYYSKVLNGIDSNNPVAQKGLEMCKE